MKSVKRLTSILLLLITGSFYFSCDTEPAPVDTAYEDGIWIVNEGGFLANNGSVSFYDEEEAQVTHGIYEEINGEFAGDVLQSVAFAGDKAYLVLNGSNKIEVVNGSTMRNLSTISDTQIDKPRYMEVIGDKAYVSVWGPYDSNYDLIDSYVAVVDLTTYQVLTTIDTDEGVERLLYNGTYLFATNFNYGASNTLAIIDPTDNTLEDQIELSAGPNGIVEDANGKIWVMCRGTYQGDDGVLYRIDPSTFEAEPFELGANPRDYLALSNDGNYILYSIGKDVYRMDVTADDIPSTAHFTATEVTTFYGLDVDPTNNSIYISDANGFAAAGMVHVYASDGSYDGAISAGLNPNMVIFK